MLKSASASPSISISNSAQISTETIERIKKDLLSGNPLLSAFLPELSTYLTWEDLACRKDSGDEFWATSHIFLLLVLESESTL